MYRVRFDGGPLNGHRMEIHRREDPIEVDGEENGKKVKHIYRKKSNIWDSSLLEYKYDKTVKR